MTTQQAAAGTAGELRTIEIDLSDLRLAAEMVTLDDRANAASHVYERYTEFADEGWEWVTHPADPAFDGWVVEEQSGSRVIAGVQLPSRFVGDATPVRPASHGVSAYRTRQLSGRPWTAEPGSKRWRALPRH